MDNGGRSDRGADPLTGDGKSSAHVCRSGNSDAMSPHSATLVHRVRAYGAGLGAGPRANTYACMKLLQDDGGPGGCSGGGGGSPEGEGLGVTATVAAGVGSLGDGLDIGDESLVRRGTGENLVRNAEDLYYHHQGQVHFCHCLYSCGGGGGAVGSGADEFPLTCTGGAHLTSSSSSSRTVEIPPHRHLVDVVELSGGDPTYVSAAGAGGGRMYAASTCSKHRKMLSSLETNSVTGGGDGSGSSSQLHCSRRLGGSSEVLEGRQQGSGGGLVKMSIEMGDVF